MICLLTLRLQESFRGLYVVLENADLLLALVHTLICLLRAQQRVVQGLRYLCNISATVRRLESQK